MGRQKAKNREPINTHRFRSCESKKAITTISEAKRLATVHSLGFYHCPYCGRYHLFGGTVNRLAKYKSDSAVARKMWRAERYAKRRKKLVRVDNEDE